MKNIPETFKKWVSRFQKELAETSFALKDKGAKHFQRVWLFSGLMIFISYKGFYGFMTDQAAALDTEIQSARAASKYGKSYQNASDRLHLAERRLPPSSEKDNWLTDTALSSLKAEDLTPGSISSPQEEKSGDLAHETITLEFSAKFPQLFSWINRIEQTRYLTHITSLEVSKKGLDDNDVSCSLSTMVNSRAGGTP